MHTIINELNKLSFVIAPIFYKLLFMSLTAMCIGVIIMLIRRFADKKIAPVCKYIMWGLVLVALLVPYRPQSKFSLLQTTPQIENISYREEYDKIKYETKYFINKTDNPTNAEIETMDNMRKQETSLYFKSLIFDAALPLIWFFGMIVTCLFLIIGIINLSVKIKKHTKTEYGQYDQLLKESKDTLAIKSNISLVVQDYISSPALIGIFRTKIILPEYANDLERESLIYILLHELAHFKRKDMILNYLLLILQVVYWFNPLIWPLFKYIREDMELLNDAYVIKRIGTQNSKNYLRSLVEVVSRYNGISFAPKLLCMIDGKKNIERRIKMIKLGESFKKHRILIGSVIFIVICVMAAAFLTSKSYSYGEEPPQMYAHTEEYSKQLVTESYRWTYKDTISQTNDAVDYEYYDIEYGEQNTLKFGVQPTPITAYISTAEIFRSGKEKIPAKIKSVKLYDQNTDTETHIFDYSFNGSDIMLKMPNAAGTYFYEFVFEFEKGTVHYGLKTVVTLLSSFKGLELYIWKNEQSSGKEETYFTLLDGTNRIKKEHEIYNFDAATQDIEKIGELLSQYEDGLYLFVSQMKETDFTKTEMQAFVDTLMKYMPDNSNVSNTGLYKTP